MENYRKFFKVVATVAFIGMVLFSNMLGIKNVYAYNSTIADHSKDKEFYVARRYASVENGINSYPIRLFGPYQSSNPSATKTPDVKEWEIAYCINGYFSQTLGRGWAIPSGDQSTLAYAKMPYTQENVYRMVGDYDTVEGYNYHREVPLNIDQILKKILYIGYPYDAKNLQQNLGDRQFEQVTQAVIYNYTDHSSKGAQERDTLKGIGGEVYTAYQKMVDLIDNHFDELVMPSNFEVNIYEWYHHPLRTDYVSYQNLLTSSISERRIPIKFRKVDNQNQILSGARIQVMNSDSGKDYGEWISGEDKVLNLLPGNYEFIEKSAPKGYEKAEKIVFRISNAGKVTYKNESGRYVDMPTDNGTYLLKMVDEKSSVVFRDIIFSKRNLNGDEIAGAKIQIKQDEEVVEQWISEEGQSYQISLAPGIYTFHEEAAPKGYVAVTDFMFTVKEDGTVEVHETPDAKVKDGKVVVTDQAEKKKVTFSKQDIAGNEIAGAQIQIKQGEKVVSEWTSAAGQSHQISLAPGIYTFHEEAAPKGYVAVVDFTFIVQENGTVEVYKTLDAKVKDGKVVVTDQAEKKTVTFSKQNVAGDEIAGAKIQIKQGDKVVESWTSEVGKSHTVELEPGEYIFHEEAAPNGYLAVTDFTFTLKADGKVELGKTSDAEIKDGKLVVTDQLDKKEVVFSKQDIAGKEIEGAQIELKQGEEVVASWTSKASESHKVKLVPGTYIFHEEAAPNGYLAVTDFTFTLKADGTVELGKTSDAEIKDGKLVVTDQLDKKEVVFSKQDIAGKEIEGAQIELKQGEEVVASWTSKASESHNVKLAPGTYTFHEEAAPNGYLAVTDFTFTLKADGKVELGKTSDAEIKDGKLVVTDQVEKKEVVFSKQDIAGKEIAGAQIELKQGNEVVASWTSKAGESHKVKLAPGTYTFHEEAAPNGYLAVTDFTFTVKADGTVELGETSDAKIEDGKLVVTDQVEKKEVVFSKQDIAGKEIEGAQIELKQGEEVVASWTSKAGESHKVKLAPGTYTFHEEAAPNGYLAVTDFAFTVKADGTVEVSATPDAKVENGKLVVTDQKEPDTPTYVNPKEGNLRTTVSANDLTANETHAVNLPSALSKQVKVVDTIYYTNLVAGESYQLTGALMKITANGQAQTIATQTAKVVADATGTGTWSLNFGTLALEPGTKYVIFETATSEKPLVDTNKDNQPDAPHVVEHKNPNDLAQTIVVAKEVPTPTPTPVEKGNLRTTVSAANQNGSATKPATITAEQAKKVAVKDTVMYEKLVANQAYQLVGTLMHVKDGKVTPIATQSKDVIADQTGNGQWVLDFGTLTLQSGETYVVYEVATSKEKLVDTNNDGEMDDSQVVEHKNPNDLSQTIVVENEKPTEPTKPQPKEIIFSKQNVDGEEIAGAQIQIKQNGKVISEWISEKGQSHVIKLLPGTYTFHEEAAPNGYLKVTDFEFTISEDGKVSLTGKVSDVSMVNGKLVIVDQRKEIIPPTPTPEPTPEPTPTEPQPKEITFSKQNVDGEEIAGAKIQIKQNGKVISEWTSEKGQSHVIKLLPGTYTFHEEAAPNGYLKVTDFEFSIDENGKVTVKEGQKDAKIVDGKLVVIDQRKEKTPKDELKKERKQELPKSGSEEIDALLGWTLLALSMSVFAISTRFRSYREENQ
ncbi:hypothetical protein CIRMBP1248_02146 [Enterococcus cecorum]|nr:hypothetical protein CIRMBP1256_00352 [Enterococcus cecorum]CAI3454482.1 hypothetical protein CIRMBP1248_02146 [Enterococcus cecorum]CAI3460718.1 hypothetical protein CIRMBP1313_01320 [Enterococcus cecorum]